MRIHLSRVRVSYCIFLKIDVKIKMHLRKNMPFLTFEIIMWLCLVLSTYKNREKNDAGNQFKSDKFIRNVCYFVKHSIYT